MKTFVWGLGTSDRCLRKEIRDELDKHAEQNIFAEAKKFNLTITEIGASRPICIDCEEEIKEKGIFSWSSFSKKKSKNRK